MTILWIRFAIWVLLSILVPFFTWAGLHFWMYGFLLEVKTVFVVEATMWVLMMLAFGLGQAVRGVLKGGMDAWTAFMGPIELHTLASRLKSMAEKREAAEIYEDGGTDGKEDQLPKTNG